MTSTSLNISGKIDPAALEVLAAVNQAITELAIPYIVVGATARDLVLHYGYGAAIQRATGDIDFAIEVSDWNTFNALKSSLNKTGFRETRAAHRLINQADMIIDIVPFGGIENEHAAIAWPPNGDVTMNVAGFKEACDNAQLLRIQDHPTIEIPVVTPIGMALLKTISWMDRTKDLRKKDAADLAYLLSTYELIPEVADSLYGDTTIMKYFDWDQTQSAACLMGQRSAALAHENTRTRITATYSESNGSKLHRLAEEMCNHIENKLEFARKRQLLTAYMHGFNTAESYK